MMWILTGAFVALRFSLPSPEIRPEDTFKDLAHVFVGMTLGCGIMATTYKDALDKKSAVPQPWKSWTMFLILVAAEIVAVVIK